MRYHALACSVVFLASCTISDPPPDVAYCGWELSMVAPYTCSHEIAFAVEDMAAVLHGGFAATHRSLERMVGATVVEASGQQLLLRDFEGDEEVTVSWPEAFPFPIAEGEHVAITTEHSGTRLRFDEGSLWLHAMVAFAETQDHFEIGPLEVVLQPNCHSAYGEALDAVVIGSDGTPHVVEAGQIWEGEGWVVRHFGSVRSPNEVECDMVLEGRYMSLITAHEVAPRCVSAPLPNVICEGGTAETNDAVFSTWEPPSAGWKEETVYVVHEVGAQGFTAKEVGAEVRDLPMVFSWPGELPFSIEVGEAISWEERERWAMVHTQRGSLAIFSGLDFSFEPPRTAPDGNLSLVAQRGCREGDAHIPGLQVSGEGDEVVLLPGEWTAMGGWEVRFAAAIETPPAMCDDDSLVAEGKSVSIITAHTLLE